MYCLLLSRLQRTEFCFNNNGVQGKMVSAIKLMIGEEQKFQGKALALSHTHRKFHLVFAPHLAYASAEFVITKQGIVGVSR